MASNFYIFTLIFIFLLGWTLENKESHQLMQNIFMHFLPVHCRKMDNIFVIQSKVTTHTLPYSNLTAKMNYFLLAPFKKLYFSVLSITDSAFKKIKILQEASLEHHPTTVSCPTPARRRHRTTFTQVQWLKLYL